MRFLFSLFSVVAISGTFFTLIMYNSLELNIDKLTNYNPPLATRIYDSNQKLIANLFEEEFRLYAPFDEIPPKIVEALLAVEDTMFFEHDGINVDAIFRAATKNLKEGRLAEGASTITQQLIKTTLLTSEKTFTRKIREAFLALKVETMLTKEEILERYLNQVYFGHGYYGVRTAALGYFHKELNRLSLKEIAMLVSLPKAPSFYDPTKNQEYSLSRANNVIMRLHSLGWINDREQDEALKDTPVVYNESLTQNRAPYIVDEAIRTLRDKYPDIKSGGYKIETTVDLEAQQIAQESLRYGYEEIQKKHKNPSPQLNGAMVIMENKSGRILALVGGVDYEKSSFNRATMTSRQPGSSFKPFIYSTALNLGYSPISKVPDIPRTFYYVVNGERKTWQPENYEKEFDGLVTVEHAVVRSINLATINIVDDLGVDKIVNKAMEYGFRDVPRNLSIALGSFGASPLEMAENYSIFSNYGQKVKARLINAIEDKNGKRVEFARDSKEAMPKEIMSKEQAYLMVDILKKVTIKGTGTRARVEGIETAGKTGTSNDNVDAWFCGFTPDIEAIIWYGNDDNKPMARADTGGGAAAPVFSHFFKKFLEIRPEIGRKFTIPEGVQSAMVNGEEVLFTETSKIPKTAYEAPEQEMPLF